MNRTLRIVAILGVLLLAGCGTVPPNESSIDSVSPATTPAPSTVSTHPPTGDPSSPIELPRSISSPEELVPNSVTLTSPDPDASVVFDRAAIDAHLAEIPEDLRSIEPEFVLGQYDDGRRSSTVIGVIFDGVLAAPIGHPVGAGTEPLAPAPARVVALYDSGTTEELGVWVLGCGATGERCR